MLLSRAPRPFCGACRVWLHSIWRYGLVEQRKGADRTRSNLRKLQSRPFHSTRRFATVPAPAASSLENGSSKQLTEEEMETTVRRTRDTFGETLPVGFLSPEEYTIYERLYGPPVRATLPEDVQLLSRLDEESYEMAGNGEGPSLLRTNGNGDVEEVEYEGKTIPETGIEELDVEEDEFGIAQVVADEERLQAQQDISRKDFTARMRLYQDMATALNITPEEVEQKINDKVELTDGSEPIEQEADSEENEYVVEVEEPEEEDGPLPRAHPYISGGQSGTVPTTIQIPKESFVDPITAMLSAASNKHLTEVCEKLFGGPLLPNSTATPASTRHLQQHPISLDAGQTKMTDMEANSFLAAIMPGMYATVTSTLVETRRRLGSAWLEGLLNKPGGPKILDAGAGGAGVVAARELLKTQWELMHPEGLREAIPYGKATVITGSPELRHRASQILQNTTFLPRLPDFLPERDLPLTQPVGTLPRKQYDIIIAPHGLWRLKEDYMRKAHIQNLWTLLNPNGGVLVIIEKGVPRGFELVAGARDVLLKHHILNPSHPFTSHIEQQELSGSKYSQIEPGMIAAPCTNHSQCPMYKIPGRSKGRKDYCHFSQRFIRPPYLQRILGAKSINHEDVRFSYVSVQRGTPQSILSTIKQDEESTERAHRGYNEYENGDLPTDLPFGSYFNLPRAILQPLKRHRHVTLDLCTPAGTLERWTVPKSFGSQAYRDARKSQWGDLWALGAKTRVLRDARAGKKESEKKAKGRTEISAEEREDLKAERKEEQEEASELRAMLKGTQKDARRLLSREQQKERRKRAVKDAKADGM